jgi:hypothetical protein
MKLYTLSMSMFLALSVAGCAAGDQDGGQPAAEIKVCEVEGGPCLGDTICGQDHCEPAFNRTYLVRVASVWFSSTKQLELCDQDPRCDLPRGLAVYFSNLPDPILAADSQYSTPAQIVVSEDSQLVVDLGDTSCVIDLTPDILDGGQVGCGGAGARVTLAINPL